MLVAVPFTFVDAARDARASNGEGHPGTLVVESELCPWRASCEYEGTWTSKDGRIVFERMRIKRDQPEVGQSVPAVVLPDESDDGTVYPVGYSQGVPAWAWSFFFLPVGLGFVSVGFLGVRK